MSDVLRANAHESARDEAIRSFLKANPDFLREDPALLTTLGLRLDAANIVEFGPAAISKVARAHKQESSVRRQLETVAEANFAAAQ